MADAPAEESEPAANTPSPSSLSLLTRVLIRQPLAVLAAGVLLLCAALLAVGVPPIQQEFQGYAARNTYGACIADGFESAQERALEYMAANGKQGNAGGKEQEPLTQELLDYRTLFFFHSLSGDVLSARNVNSTSAVLSAATKTLSPSFCLKADVAGACQAPWTLMSVFQTSDEAHLKALIRNENSVLGLGPFLRIFLGADLDISTGRTSWMQGHLRMGAPLAGLLWPMLST